MVSTNPSSGCVNKAGPGPHYMLPPTVGYEGHDITRDRRPAFSIGSRLPTKMKDSGPGPSILVENYDRFGKTTAPAFTLSPLLKTKLSSDTPGPGSYLPIIPKDSPAFSIKARTPISYDKNPGPGPNAYLLPSSLHGKVEHLGQRLPIPGEKICSPGPAKYLAQIPYKGPQFSFGVRLPPKQDNSVKPGPATYLPAYNTYRSAPMYSFGMKHSECKAVPLTDADKQEDCDDIKAA